MHTGANTVEEEFGVGDRVDEGSEMEQLSDRNPPRPFSIGADLSIARDGERRTHDRRG